MWNVLEGLLGEECSPAGREAWVQWGTQETDVLGKGSRAQSPAARGRLPNPQPTRSPTGRQRDPLGLAGPCLYTFQFCPGWRYPGGTPACRRRDGARWAPLWGTQKPSNSCLQGLPGRGLWP